MSNSARGIVCTATWPCCAASLASFRPTTLTKGPFLWRTVLPQSRQPALLLAVTQGFEVNHNRIFVGVGLRQAC
jgi:hypothetical protein